MDYVANNKEKMLDDRGRFYTQSLFLEFCYNDVAIYTLKDEDYEYNGQLYRSIKKCYMEISDPTEYTFAQQYFYSWKHWLRICENKQIRENVDEWRAELEVKLRSQAYKQMVEDAKKGKPAANKWLAEKGWDKRQAGRPSKAEIEKEKKIQANISSEYEGDVIRLLKTRE